MAVAPAIFTVPRWSLPIPPLGRLPTAPVDCYCYDCLREIKFGSNDRERLVVYSFLLSLHFRRRCYSIPLFSCLVAFRCPVPSIPFFLAPREMA
jgi:hypothetical protein